MARLRLGINIDHVATLRNARGGRHPDPLRAALLAAHAGADGITVHLREDRRHIRDADLGALMADQSLPINLEMAATQEMLEIAQRTRPHAVCLVPERRAELTTEGGLDVLSQEAALRRVIAPLAAQGARVSLFVDADPRQIEAAARCGAQAVELHTGAFCADFRNELLLKKLQDAAAQAVALGLECHAGHGIDYDSVTPIARIKEICELNIGHFLVGEALFCGLEASIRRMRALMDEARA